MGNRPRFTYFIKWGEYLKIGSSNSPRDRNVLATMRPVDLDTTIRPTILGCVPCVDMSEMAALYQFRVHQVAGCREWFHWSDIVMSKVSDLPLIEPPAPRVNPATAEKDKLAGMYGWKYADQVRRLAHELIARCEADRLRRITNGTYSPRAGDVRKSIDGVCAEMMRTPEHRGDTRSNSMLPPNRTRQ